MGAKNHSGLRTEVRRGLKVFVIDFRFINGKGQPDRHRRDAPVQQKGAALEEARRRMRLAAEKGWVEDPNDVPTFKAWVEGDFRKLVLVRFKPSTREGYEDLLYHPVYGLVALIGSKRLDRIGALEYRTVEASVLARGALPRYALVCLRMVMREAGILKVIPSAPHLPKLPKRSEKLPEAPPWEHVSQMLAAANGWLRIAIALAAFAGLRMGELRSLQIGDIDLGRKRLFIRRAFSANQLGTPKGVHEESLPIAPALADVLRGALEGKAPAEFVVARNGAPIPEGTLDSALRGLQERLGFAPVRSFHKLRHFFATFVLQGGAHVEALRLLLRHQDLSSTARYVHALKGDLDLAVASFPPAPSPGNDGATMH